MPQTAIKPLKLDMLKDVPHALPYQGSKRGLAHAIVPLLPDDTGQLIEPFCGSAAVTIAALHATSAPGAHIRDLNAPLMELWDRILDDVDGLADEYEDTWTQGSRDPVGVYAAVRNRFNKTHQPADLLYLLARCVKAAVRYNSRGEFNQGADNRRLGAQPSTMRSRLTATAAVLRGKTTTSAGDFRELLHAARPEDVVYMDSPYQGTSGSRDARYLSGLGYDEYVVELRQAAEAGTSFLVSYDGSSGGRSYGRDLPDDLELLHLHLAAGTSSQATLSGDTGQTIESLYVSPALVQRLGGQEPLLERLRVGQLELLR